MEAKENGKEQVHPVAIPGFTYGDGSYELPSFKPGLTKREYFAAMAMQGILCDGGHEFRDTHKVRIAELSVAHADALLEQLSKPS